MYGWAILYVVCENLENSPNIYHKDSFSQKGTGSLVRKVLPL